MGVKQATDMGMFSLIVPCWCCRHYQRLQEIPLASLFFICFSSLCSSMYSQCAKAYSGYQQNHQDVLCVTFPLFYSQHSYDQTPLLLFSSANNIFKFILFVSPICRRPIRVRCRYSRRLRPYSRQITMTWT